MFNPGAYRRLDRYQATSVQVFRMSMPPLFSALRATVAATCLSLLAPIAQAALTIDSTRIVLPSNKRSASLVVANPSKAAYAAQVWVNTASDDTTTSVPLLASPALFRLDSGREQLVQINVLPNDLPTDRESLFYFNVQELPQVDPDARNVLNIALRTRIKLFYRPSQLKEKPETRLNELQWSAQQLDGAWQLVVDNPTPFHFTFGRLEVNGEQLDAKAMAIPMGRQHFPLPAQTGNQDIALTFTIINDYGGLSAPTSQTVTRH